jgi:arylsulfatase A
MLVTAVESEAAEKPNIVLIMADDLGYECVSPGSARQTPHIDQLAERGMRFTNAFSNPICTPSRVKIMTGMYNVRNYTQFGRLDRDQITFAHQLKKAGYATAVAGKWQLGDAPDSPQHFGFDVSCLWQHTHGRTDGQGRDTRYPNPHLEINGRDRELVEKEYTGGKYAPDIFTKFLTDFMARNAKKDKPFLAYYPMVLTHCPFVPTPDSEDWDPTSQGAKRYKGPGGKQAKHRRFSDMLSYTDKLVGRIDQKLKSLGIRDNTLIIFTTDNGTDRPIVTKWRDRKVPGGKGQVNDRGMRAAFVVAWPDAIEPGSTSDRLVEFSDVLPTLCDAAGAPLPEGRPMDGVTLVPAMRGKDGPDKPWIYTWYRGRVMARTEHYMLRRKIGDSGGTLFHYSEPFTKKKLPGDQLTDKQRAIKQKLIGVVDRLAKTRKSEVGPAE